MLTFSDEFYHLRSKENLETSPMTSGPKPLTYRQFIELVAEVLAAAWGESWRDQFGPVAPLSREMTTPYISYSLQRKAPSEDPKGNFEPRYRGHVIDKENPGHVIDIYGQLFDHYITFNCLSPSPDQADQLAEDFEEFMVTYRSFFIQNGVRKLFLFEQGPDQWDKSQKEPIYSRPLVYFTRLDRLIAVPSTVLESVSTHVNLSTELSL